MIEMGTAKVTDIGPTWALRVTHRHYFEGERERPRDGYLGLWDTEAEALKAAEGERKNDRDVLPHLLRGRIRYPEYNVVFLAPRLAGDAARHVLQRLGVRYPPGEPAEQVAWAKYATKYGLNC